MKIVLHGLNEVICNEFYQRVVDQMLHEITPFQSVDEDYEADVVICFYTDDITEDIISYCTSKVTPLLLVRPWNKNNDLPFKNHEFLNTTVTIRDLLITDKSSKWGPSDVNSWMNSLLIGEKLDHTFPSRFWVSISDTVEALLVLIENQEIFGDEILLSGRKCWNPKELISELEILWTRFSKVKSNNLGISELEVQEPLLVQSSYDGEKPNLERLHLLLKEVNGYGWTPRTPMRVTLMKCLAGIEKITKSKS